LKWRGSSSVLNSAVFHTMKLCRRVGEASTPCEVGQHCCDESGNGVSWLLTTAYVQPWWPLCVRLPCAGRAGSIAQGKVPCCCCWYCRRPCRHTVRHAGTRGRGHPHLVPSGDHEMMLSVEGSSTMSYLQPPRIQLAACGHEVYVTPPSCPHAHVLVRNGGGWLTPDVPASAVPAVPALRRVLDMQQARQCLGLPCGARVLQCAVVGQRYRTTVRSRSSSTSWANQGLLMRPIGMVYHKQYATGSPKRRRVARMSAACNSACSVDSACV
jgi:hypothetical protein